MKKIGLVCLCLMLAGCSGGGGLATYSIQLSDLPPGWVAVDYDREELQELWQELGMTSNPGYANPPGNEFESMNLTQMYVSIYAPNQTSEGILSYALSFASIEHAQVFVADMDWYCEYEGHVFTLNHIVTLVSFEYDASDDVINTTAQNFQQRTGMTALCN